MRTRVPRTIGAVIAEAFEIARDPALLLWALYILLTPLYIFPSGLPQPGDLLILALAPIVLVQSRGRIFREGIRPSRALMVFTLYVVSVDLIWSVALNAWSLNGKEGFLLSPLIYIYNTLFFLVALLLYQRHGSRLLWLTVHVSTTALVAQVAISFFYRSGGARESGLFDSPNQLGYFAVLGASVIVIGQRRLGISLQHATIGLCAALYLSLLSSSKAALGAVGILAVLGLFHRPRTIIVATLVFAALLQWSEHVQSALHGAVDRIRNDETLGFFEERGYDRIVNNPEYLLFGAGEGAMRRFKDTTLIGTHEIHSSGGTLFFCYGIVGVLLFVVFLLRVVEGMRLRFALLLLPALAYGITHQGLRFTFLWVLIAMMISLKNVERQRRAAAMPPAPVRTAREAAPDAVPPGGSS